MASVGYRLLDGQTSLDVLGGLRYTRLEADAKVKVATVPPIVFPGGSVKADGTEEWIDGVIGLRVLHPLTDQVSLVGYVDAGAGGSDFTYQVIAGANWEFKKDFIAKAGYRQIYWDYSKDGSTWDMTAAGPYLGLGIRF
jgi:opacity protein-like surface antigen